MKIGVFTLYTPGWQPLADVTLPVMQKYCARHGYDLTVHCGGFGDRSRLIGLQKTSMALMLLARFDALWVVDLDVLVTNHDIKLESFLDDDHGLFVCHDSNHGLNAGSYLIRNTEQARAFLRVVLGTELAPGECEQDAMQKVLKYSNFSNGFCKVLGHPSINSYRYDIYGETKTHEEGQWSAGDFALHLPGMTNAKRIEIFRALL
jgi:hypothetical protein